MGLLCILHNATQGSDLVDAYVALTGFQSQQTNEPKSADAPDNLFEPIPGYNKIEGDFSAQARAWSL